MVEKRAKTMLALTTFEDIVLTLAAVALGGFMLGMGLVFGAFVARQLRRYMKDEGLDGKN